MIHRKPVHPPKKVSLRLRKEARRHSAEMHASAMNRGAENEVCPDYDIAATCWRWIRAKIRQTTCTTHRCRSDCPAETEGKKGKGIMAEMCLADKAAQGRSRE